MSTRYARVCPNGTRYHHPDAGNKGGGDTNTAGRYGFGFEEWLGRAEWVWDGPRLAWMPDGADFRCGFLQALQRQPARSVRDVELFRVTDASERFAVGRICGCRSLTPAESTTVFEHWHASGRLETMQQELDAANAQAMLSHGAVRYPSRLGDMGRSPQELFNLCFRAEDFHLRETPEKRPYPHGRYEILYR